MLAKVLVADDEEDIRVLVSATLGRRYSLILASDGEEALRRAREDGPDLVFLDAMMPKMDGFEVCSRLKADTATAHVKVVMLTAMAQELDRRRAEESGVDYYFTKPFSPTALLSKVEELVG